MANCINVLDWYQNDDISVEEFLNILFDFAVEDYHSDVDTHITNDCIKTAQIGTYMKRNIKELINKYLYEKDRSPRVMFFPINLYLMSSNSDESSTFDKILKEITEDIFHILLGSIDASDRDTFILTCLDWEKTFFIVWKDRVKRINSEYEAVIEKRFK